MRRPHILLLLSSILALTCGCGTSSAPHSSDAQSLTPGNWLVVGTSSPDTLHPYQNTYIRGALSGSTDAVSDTTGITSTSGNCLGNFNLSNVVFTGSMSGKSLTLTSPDLGVTNHGLLGSDIAINATADTATHFLGTYTRSPGKFVCTDTDSGTVDGVLVGSLTGNWSGSIVSYSSTTYDVEFSVTQSTSTSTMIAGAFPLSGTVTMHGLPCFYYGAIDPTQSYIQGENIVIFADAGGATLSFGGYLPGPPTASAITINTYQGGGACSDSGQSGSLTKLQ